DEVKTNLKPLGPMASRLENANPVEPANTLADPGTSNSTQKPAFSAVRIFASSYSVSSRPFTCPASASGELSLLVTTCMLAKPGVTTTLPTSMTGTAELRAAKLLVAPPSTNISPGTKSPAAFIMRLDFST